MKRQKGSGEEKGREGKGGDGKLATKRGCVLKMKNIRCYWSPRPLVPVQPRRQISKPLCKRNMDALRARDQHCRIGFSVMVLEDFGYHAMHDFAEFSLLHKRANKRQIILVFRGRGVFLDIAVKKRVPLRRIS
jgi:hypothetical protein